MPFKLGVGICYALTVILMTAAFLQASVGPATYLGLGLFEVYGFSHFYRFAHLREREKTPLQKSRTIKKAVLE